MDKSPDAFRTISEAADELDLPQHVLRFWETRFNQIKPLKRGGGRRYYRPDDVQLLKGIRHLLYDQGFTIKGVQRILKEQGARHVIAIGETGQIQPIAPQPQPGDPDFMEDAGAVPVPENGAAHPQALPQPEPLRLTENQRARLKETLAQLMDCKVLLDKARSG
ncbi:MerR family transcriptional regulator [Pelagibacterium xiamenense]|uniref:MerR family transcriptional regulator n=1 Tax=Pelagibacterium xiamenense TaxID=2901140 RepID=UPI001E2CCB55|nr:MerR family transcriptional regulator [Pelagibacterium xiamenense]MCD7060800.1 MerR family transcriptional regulator [Pelagibacterium xiamenense]